MNSSCTARYDAPEAPSQGTTYGELNSAFHDAMQRAFEEVLERLQADNVPLPGGHLMSFHFYIDLHRRPRHGTHAS